MFIVDSIKSAYNYGVLTCSNVVNKIATNPSAVKKTGQLVAGIIEGLNFKQCTDYLPDLMKNIKGTNDIIDFYSSFKNIIFWMNPFETQKIDKQKFVDSLAKGLDFVGKQKKTPSETKKQKLLEEQNKKAIELFNKVVERGSAATHPHALTKLLEKALIEDSYSATKAQEIARQTQIYVKPRTFLKLLRGICDTVAVFAVNLVALDKWKLIDLSQISKDIGTRFPIFTQMSQEVGKRYPIFNEISSKLTMKTFIGSVSTVGCGIGTIDAIGSYYKARKVLLDPKQSSDALKTAQKERNHALWDFAASGVDLISTGLPLVKTLNTPTTIALTIATKVTGLLGIIFKTA